MNTLHTLYTSSSRRCTLHTLHQHTVYTPHTLFTRAMCTPANSARADSVYPALSLNTLHIMHTYTSTPYTLHILHTQEIQYILHNAHILLPVLWTTYTPCALHPLSTMHILFTLHYNTLCTLYHSHCTHHAYTLFILHTLYPTPCTLSPPVLCTWCMMCTPLYSEQYTQYKDIYRRTIEMLQSVCIFKANCCLKVHNAHLMLSSPISE